MINLLQLIEMIAVAFVDADIFFWLFLLKINYFLVFFRWLVDQIDRIVVCLRLLRVLGRILADCNCF